MRSLVVCLVATCAAACAGRSISTPDAGDQGDAGETSSGGNPGAGGANPGLGGSSVGGSSDGGTVARGGSGVGGTVTAGEGPGGQGGTSGGPPVARCLPGAFCQVSPALVANDLRAVWGSGPRDVWAVGVKGTIVHYDGNGWRRVESGTTADLFGVSGSSDRDVWIVGSQGTVLHFDGATFDAGLGPDTMLELRDIAAAGEHVWIAANEVLPNGPNPRVFHFDGASWEADDPAGDDFKDYLGIFANSPSDVWVTGVATYRFDGRDWQRIDIMPGYDVWASPSGRAWAVSDTFTYYFDGASPVIELQVGLNGIWGASEEELWAVGRDGQIFRRTDERWNVQPTPASRHLHDVWGSSTSDVWIVGDAATILHFDGEEWSATNSGSDVAFTGIWGATDDEQWIVGKPGVVSRFDGVSSLVDEPVPGSDELPYAAIAGTARDDVVAVGIDGRIAESDGREWAASSSPVATHLNAVWAGSSKVLAVGDAETVIQRTEPGVWRLELGPGERGLAHHCVWGSSDDDIWVCEDLGILHYLSGDWNAPISGGVVRPQVLWGSGPDDVWSISSDGLDHFNGQYWESLPSLQPSLEVTSFNGATGCSANDVWAVGYGGQIYHYDGAEWSRMESGTTNDLWGVRCSPGGVWVVGEGGIILHRNPDE